MLGSSANIFLEKDLPCCAIKTVHKVVNGAGSGQSKDTLQRSGCPIKSKHSAFLKTKIVKCVAVLPHGSRRLEVEVAWWGLT